MMAIVAWLEAASSSALEIQRWVAGSIVAWSWME